MFTGIIEELGTLRQARRASDSILLTIGAQVTLAGTRVGDSIAVNGVCLTVTNLTSDRFSADVMLETLNKTNLPDLSPGTKVNLERALTLQSRLSGHLVSGHVDSVGQIRSIKPSGIAFICEVSAPPAFIASLIPKGSVAVDGISLTIIDVFPDSFTFSLIPHTFTHTTLGFKKIGATVNLEADLIGKYVTRWLENRASSLPSATPPQPGQTSLSPNQQSNSSLSLDFLRENGFV